MIFSQNVTFFVNQIGHFIKYFPVKIEYREVLPYFWSENSVIKSLLRINWVSRKHPLYHGVMSNRRYYESRPTVFETVTMDVLCTTVGVVSTVLQLIVYESSHTDIGSLGFRRVHEHSSSHI